MQHYVKVTVPEGKKKYQYLILATTNHNVTHMESFLINSVLHIVSAFA